MITRWRGNQKHSRNGCPINVIKATSRNREDISDKNHQNTAKQHSFANCSFLFCVSCLVLDIFKSLWDTTSQMNWHKIFWTPTREISARQTRKVGSKLTKLGQDRKHKKVNDYVWQSIIWQVFGATFDLVSWNTKLMLRVHTLGKVKFDLLYILTRR